MNNEEKPLDPFALILGNTDKNGQEGSSSILEVCLKEILSRAFKPSNISQYVSNLSKLNEHMHGYFTQCLPSTFHQSTDSASYDVSLAESTFSRNTPDETGTEADQQSSASIENPLMNEPSEADLSAVEEDIPEASAELQSSETRDRIEETPNPALVQQASTPYPRPFVRVFGIQPSVLDTHDMLVIRLSLPEGLDENDCEIDINELRASIKWKSRYVEQLIPLPPGVLGQNASASVKGNILEIKIPKSPNDCPKEIQIRHF
ncbi:MAG: Hsp20/alpha crystallin family protein [Clostridia bacterium]|nr:Hsp20/alpha crystallin family protein [Clostridia bacterium]